MSKGNINDPTVPGNKKIPYSGEDSDTILNKNKQRNELNKALLSLQDENIVKNRDLTNITTNIDLGEYTDYINLDQINLKDVEGMNKLRAENQSTGEQLRIELANFVPNVVSGFIRDIGSLGAGLTEWGNDRDYSNALTEWAERARDPFGDIYLENPNNPLFMDSGSLIKNIGGLVESIVQFAGEAYLTGGALGAIGKTGSTLMKGLATSSKIANAVKNEIRGAEFLQKSISGLGVGLEKVIPQTANSFLLGYVESAITGAQTYKTIYDSMPTPKGLNEEELIKFEEKRKTIASDGASAVVQLGTVALGILNFGVINPLFQTKKVILDGAKFADRVVVGEEKGILNKVKGLFSNESPTMESVGEWKTRLNNMSIKNNKGLRKYVKGDDRLMAYPWEMGKEGFEEVVTEFEGQSSEEIGQRLQKGENRMSALFGGLRDEATKIANGEDPNAIKSLILNFALGAVGGGGHKFLLSRATPTKVYQTDAEGNRVLMKDKDGNDIQDKYAYKRTTNYRKNKAEREEVFNKYRNSLVADLSIIEKADMDLKKIAEVGEKEAGITKDQVFKKLFDVQAYNMVTLGATEHLKQSIKEVADIDNKTDLGIAINERMTAVRAQAGQLKESIKNGNTDPKAVEKLAELNVEYQKLVEDYKTKNGKSQAMLLGYSDEIEKADGSNVKTASEFKEKANETIKYLDKIDSDYKRFVRVFGYGKTGEFELPQYLLDLSIAKDRYTSEAAIDELAKLKDSYVKEGSINKSTVLNAKLLELERNILEGIVEDSESNKYAKKFANERLVTVNAELEKNKAFDSRVKLLNKFDEMNEKYKILNNKLTELKYNRETDDKRVGSLGAELKELQTNSDVLVEANKKASETVHKLLEEASNMDGRKKEAKDKREAANALLETINENNNKISKLMEEGLSKKQIQSDLMDGKSTYSADEKKLNAELLVAAKDVAVLSKEKEDMDKLDKQVVDDIKSKYKDIGDRVNYQVWGKAMDYELEHLQTREGINDFVKARELLNNNLVEKGKPLKKHPEGLTKLQTKAAEMVEMADKVNKAVNKIETVPPVNQVKKDNKEESDVLEQQGKDTKIKSSNTNQGTESATSKEIRNVLNKQLMKAKDLVASANSVTLYGKETVEKFFKYLDDMEYLVNAQRELSLDDLSTFEYLNKAAAALQQVADLYAENELKHDPAKANEVRNIITNILRTSLNTTETAKLTDEQANVLFSRKIPQSSDTAVIFNSIMDDAIHFRELTRKQPSSHELVSLSEYNGINNKEEILKKLAEEVASGGVFYSLGSNSLMAKDKDSYSRVMNYVNQLVIIGRLADADILTEYSNVAKEIIQSFKDTAEKQDLVSDRNHADKIQDANAIIAVLNHYYNGMLDFIERKTGEREYPTFSGFMVTDTFLLANPTLEDIKNTTNNEFSNPNIQKEKLAREEFDASNPKRIMASTVANSSMTFDRITGEVVGVPTVALDKESANDVGVGSELEFVVEDDYEGDIFIMWNGEVAKGSWKDFKDTHKDDREWYVNHVPIAIKSNGKTIGYVWMESSINESYIADEGALEGNLEQQLANIREVRRSIVEDANSTGKVVSEGTGFLNVAKEFGLADKRMPIAFNEDNSVGIVKRDGVYVGVNRVLKFDVKTAKIFTNLEGTPVVLLTAPNGMQVPSILYKARLDGTSEIESSIKTKNSVDVTVAALREMVGGKARTEDGILIETALRNTVFMKAKPTDSLTEDRLASEIGSSNVGLFVSNRKDGSVSGFSFRNQSMQPIHVTNIEEFDANVEMIKHAVGMLNYNVNSSSLNRDVPILEITQDGKLTTKNIRYNEYLKDKMITKVVGKRLEKNSNYKPKEDSKNMTKEGDKHVEYVYTNNAVMGFKVTAIPKPLNTNKETKTEQVNQPISRKDINIDETAVQNSDVVALNDESEAINLDGIPSLGTVSNLDYDRTTNNLNNCK